MSDLGTTHWPTEIRLKKAEKRLEIDFDDGTTVRFDGVKSWVYLQVSHDPAQVYVLVETPAGKSIGQLYFRNPSACRSSGTLG